MGEKGRFQSQRSRTILGLVVVALSLTFTAVLAGIGFARSSVISAGQYQYGKVTICHHTHSKTNPTVTITISQNALPAHLKHGDTIGACKPSAPTQPGKGKKQHGNGKSSTPANGQTGTSSPSHKSKAPSKGKSNKPNAPSQGQNTTGSNGQGHGKPSGTPGKDNSGGSSGSNGNGNGGSNGKGHGK